MPKSTALSLGPPASLRPGSGARPLPLPAQPRSTKLDVVSIAPLMAEAIRAIYLDESVSKIFGGENHI